MSIITSRWPTVLDALITQLRALSGHRDPESTSVLTGIPIFDGPQYGIMSDRAATWWSVGWSGDPDAPEDAGDVTQDIGPLNPVVRPRDEVGLIQCRIVTQTGDRGRMKAARDATFTELGLLEVLLRSTPTLGLDQSWMRYVSLVGRARFQQQYVAGPVFTLDCSVGFKARI